MQILKDTTLNDRHTAPGDTSSKKNIGVAHVTHLSMTQKYGKQKKCTQTFGYQFLCFGFIKQPSSMFAFGNVEILFFTFCKGEMFSAISFISYPKDVIINLRRPLYPKIRK